MKKEKHNGFARSEEWWSYKLPPLLGASYLTLYVFEVPFESGWKDLLALLIWMIGAAGFGYYVNDVFDIEADRKANKPNTATNHSLFLRLAFCTAMLLMAVLPWYIVSKTDVLPLVVFHLGLLLLYSAPPIRVKERGWLGVLFDGLYAHMVPVLIAIYTTQGDQTWMQWNVVVVFLLCWQLLLGLRSIMEHQLADLDFDQRSGTRTIVNTIGPRRTTDIARQKLPIIELVFLSAFLLCLSTIQPKIGVFIIFVVSIIYIMRPIGEGILQYHPSRKYLLPETLNQIQEQIVPLTFATAICFLDSRYLVVLVVHILVFMAGNRSLLNLGKDHILKPLYHQGLLAGSYAIYYNGFYPLYYSAKKGVLWIYFSVVWKVWKLLVWLFYQTVVWSFYNILWRALSWLWHIAFYVRYGQWHESWKEL